MALHPYRACLSPAIMIGNDFDHQCLVHQSPFLNRYDLLGYENIFSEKLVAITMLSNERCEK